MFVDVVSMQFSISHKLSEIVQLNDNIKNLIQNGDTSQEYIEKLYQTKCKMLQTLSETKGIISKTHEKFPFV